MTNGDLAFPPRLLIIDDHPLFCEAMEMTVGDIFSASDIITASNLKQAMGLLDDSTADIIALDLNLPDVEGVDGLIRLRQLAPHAQIVVVSSMSDNQIIMSVLEAGAVGFIPKDSSRAALIRAFETVLQGKIYVPEDYHAPHTTGLDQERHLVMEKIRSLTPQQARILGLVCEGKLNKQIAWELSISETTVKAHLTAVLRKLDVQTRTQASLLARKLSYTEISGVE